MTIPTPTIAKCHKLTSLVTHPHYITPHLHPKGVAKYTAYSALTAGAILIRSVNTLARRPYNLQDHVIAAELGIPASVVEDITKQRYVQDIAHLFKADEDITLAEYNEIHARYVPGKQSPCNQYRLARELLIHPDTVVSIAGRRFTNANTHPSRYAKAEPVKAVERNTERVMTADDVARGMKLLGWSWPDSDIAADLKVDVSRIATLKRVKLNRWGTADALALLNKGIK